MKRLLLMIGGALAVLIVGALLVGAVLLARLDVKGEIEKAALEAMGRPLTIAGDVDLTLFPTLGVDAHDVRIANVEGGEAPHLLIAKNVRVGVRALALLERRLDVTRLVLTEPELALEVDAAGRPNWLLGAADVEAAQAGEDPLKDLADLDLGDVRLENGVITYVNRQGGAPAERLEAVSLRAHLDSLAKPLKITGAAEYKGQTTAIDLTLTDIRAALSGGVTPAKLALRAKPLEADFDGRIDVAAGALSGKLSARGQSLRALNAWLGEPMPPGAGLELFSVAGNLAMTPGVIDFADTALALDAIDGRGDFTLSVSGPVPHLSGRLQLGPVDLTPYLAPPPQAEAAAPTVVIEAVDVSRGGWSEAAMDLAGLKAIDADLTLTTGPLTVNKIRFDQAQMNIALKSGYLVVGLNRTELYGGIGKGRLEIDARNPAVRIRNELDLSGLAAHAFLKDAVGLTNLEGAAQMKLAFEGEGLTQAALMRSLDGQAQLALTDGALRGVDLAGVSLTIRNALSGKMIGPDARTPFKTFTTSFALADGVAATRDLRIRALDAEITAAGLIDIGGQMIDLRITPKSESLLSKMKLIPGAALAAPFRVSGPWSKVGYKLDLGGAAKAAIDQGVAGVERRAKAAATEQKARLQAEAKAELERKRAEAEAAARQKAEAAAAGALGRLIPGLAPPPAEAAAPAEPAPTPVAEAPPAPEAAPEPAQDAPPPTPPAETPAPETAPETAAEPEPAPT